ncbi:hypothetical protein BOTBODRAFT_189910 [Botryobasidium botryosum FD-172 SS1]|uniref:Uncharacterized protein n=1 Tax=Botryobasidium botryosum (strain FD-172 SS1) TaxID=930990 RepID=A0A067MIK0_BOTB1|nr:hypothetical protein BOTBODRAFT_189910 [Botryobasidium botryosum FD-172 SS1]
MPTSDNSSPHTYPTEQSDDHALRGLVTKSVKAKQRPFQLPQLVVLAKHAVYCILAGPVLYYTVHGANALNADINQFRLLTNVVTTILSILLSSTLMDIAARHFHASTWATILEAQEGRSVTINELDGLTTGGSVTAPLNLLIKRSKNARKQSQYPWTLNILVYLILIGCAKGLAFFLERTFTIDAYLTQQPNGVPQNVSVLGDLSEKDMDWVRIDENGVYGFYTASAYTSRAQMNTLQYVYNNYSIFLAEVLPGQLLPGAQGAANFTQLNVPTVINAFSAPTKAAVTNTPMGRLVRWPRWGIRVKCQLLPNPTLHLVPLSSSNLTYVYLPNSLVLSLAADLQVSVNLTGPSLTFLQGNDTLPAGLDPSTIYDTYVTSQNGQVHTGDHYYLDDGSCEDPNVSNCGRGWKILDVHLVRINKASAPNGKFPVAATINNAQIGVDAAVCLEVVEPWIVDAYNITGRPPYTMQVFGPGNNISLVDKTLHSGVASALNSSNISDAYTVAMSAARRDMMKELSEYPFYPSPTLVEFTGNSVTDGPNGYTRLSPSSMETVIGGWDSSRALPYLIGTRYITAETRDDRIIGSGTVNKLYLGLVLGLTLLVGIIADVSIPRLPGGIPLRDFGALSAITVARPALRSLDIALGQAPRSESERLVSSDDPPPSPGVGPEFYMDLDDLKEKIGDAPAYASH